MCAFFTGKPEQQKLEQFIGKDILTAEQFTLDELETVINLAAYYEDKVKNKVRLYDMDGKVMSSLFFESSTRTRLSFETAMLRLGGNVVTVAESADTKISSTSKGETLRDTIMVNDGYTDVIVCRTAETGAAQIAADAAAHPVINAGDGAGHHPSQALLDVYTILKEKGTLDGLTVAMIGDLKYGRTVHTLPDFLAYYDVKMIFASPDSLKMPEEVLQRLRNKGVDFTETNSLKEACEAADVLYMTRVQRERFDSLEAYEAVKDEFIMDGELVKCFRPGAIIMHPLPRVNEITPEVDAYPGAAYFRQAHNGLPIRMALLALVTGSVK